MANLKSLFGNLFKKAGGYTDDALRLASNYGDEIADTLEDANFWGVDASDLTTALKPGNVSFKNKTINPYLGIPENNLDDLVNRVGMDSYIESINPENHLTIDNSLDYLTPLRNDFVSKADEDWLTQDMLSKKMLDSGPEPYVFDDGVNPFTNPPTDFRYTDPFEDTFNYISNTAFTSPEQLNDPNIYTTLTDIDSLISKTPPPDLNNVGWASTPSLDEHQRVLRNLYDRLTRNWDVSNPYNERIVSSYLDKLYPYSQTAENEVFMNKFLSKLPRRDHGIFE